MTRRGRRPGVPWARGLSAAMRIALSLLLALGSAAAEPSLSLPARPAAPAPVDLPVGLSLAVGAATALVPLIVGTALVSIEGPLAERRAGIGVMVAGLALAPIVSHLIVGEWRRALGFGAVPVAAAAVMAVLLTQQDDVITDLGTPASRVPFVVVLCASLFASGVGLVDSALAGQRAQARRITVAPMLSGHLVGLAFAGTL